MRPPLLLGILCGLYACSNGTSAPVPTDFTSVDTALEAFLQEEGLEGANLVVVDREVGVLHRRSFGAFTTDRVSLIASASKTLSAGVIMRLDDLGMLDIDAPISSYVPWEGERDFTLAQMLSNSSGLVGLADDPLYGPYVCQYISLETMPGCGEAIYTADDADDIIPPDTRFRYGGAQWQLAGAVAEQVTGKTWAELVEETYVVPCDLQTFGYSNHYLETFTSGGNDGFGYPAFFMADLSNLPRTTNPNIEGGAYTTIDDYGALLWMQLRGGLCGSERVLSEEAIARMQEDRVGMTYDATTSDPQFPGYGLGWWVSRDEPGLVSDGGAYGAMPWIDNNRGYAAMILLEDHHSMGRAAYLRLKPLLDALFDAARPPTP